MEQFFRRFGVTVIPGNSLTIVLWTLALLSSAVFSVVFIASGIISITGGDSDQNTTASTPATPTEVGIGAGIDLRTPTAMPALTATPTAGPVASPVPSPTPAPVSPTLIAVTGTPAQAPTIAAPIIPISTVVVTASVSNASPSQQSEVTITATITSNGQPIYGLPMLATWHYKTISSICTALTSASGIASCTRNIGTASSDYTVTIDVGITWKAQVYTASARFTPK